MRNFLEDIRFGLRRIRFNPGTALAVILVLALGIGANTAIFTIVDAVLLRPLPYKDPGQLTMLWETEPELPSAPVTGPDYQDWQTMTHSYQAIAAGTEGLFNLTGSGEPQRVNGFAVAANMLDLFGISPALGRSFQAGEDQPGRDREVVLTYGLWQRAFGGDRAILGRTIALDGKNYSVIGVMPEQFRFPKMWGLDAELFVPMVIGAEPWQKLRGSHWLFVMGRLRPGVSVSAADAELKTIAKNLEKSYPDTNAQIGAHVVGLHEQLTGKTAPLLMLLLLAVAFVLAIACANVANLMLAQAARRHREMAVRLALGASSLRIVRQLLTESVLLSSFGALVGLAVALLLERAVLTLGPPGYVPSTNDVHLNVDVFIFAAALAILTGIISGLVPAWNSAGTRINETLKEGTRTAGAGRSRFRSALIVGEVASALVLLFGAALTIQSLRKVLEVDLGFNPSHVLTMKVSPPKESYPDDAHIARFYDAVLEKLRRVSGVVAASAVSELPFEGGRNGSILIEGQSRPKGEFVSPLVEAVNVSPGYFEAMQIPILAGRDFTQADAPRDLAVINQTMARKFWPNQNPIGKRYTRDPDQPHWIEVIGVVGDTHESGLETPPISEAFYMERPNEAQAYMNLVVRTALPPEAMARQVAASVHEVDSQLPVFEVASMQEILSRQTGMRWFNVFLLGLFAAMALLLAAVGIYGVMSQLVAQRTREIGVRIALGASRVDVLRLVLGHSLQLLLIGVLAGIVLALASGRFLATIIYQIKPYDPVIIAAISLVLCFVALLASYIPAHRATRVDPVVALRYE